MSLNISYNDLFVNILAAMSKAGQQERDSRTSVCVSRLEGLSFCRMILIILDSLLKYLVYSDIIQRPIFQ
jgi:hypothetical protein